ncbi:MAG: prolyl oligopeptidase family serine peptidase [Chloroflexi bacterium]|nr:prolyl oligopeptidase family serine peptidase [Chloroflexota bacterium]
MQVPEEIRMLEKMEADRFFATVDQCIRLFGVEHMHKRDFFFGQAVSRIAINTPIDWSELHRLIENVRRYADWYPAFSSSADHFARLASAAEAKERFVTAGQHYLRASLLYHYAILYLRENDPDRAEGLARKVDLYVKGSRYYDPPAEPVKIPYDNVMIPCYFRLPYNVEKAPGLVMIDGANSTKEEFHNWSTEFLRRGVATLTFDGPGQGEMAVKHGGPEMEFRKYHEVVGALIDYVQGRPEIDPNRIGLFGQSCGGWLGVWTAAHEPRSKCLLSMGGFYDFRRFPHIPLAVQEEVSALFGIHSVTEGWAYLQDNGNLKGVASKIKCPTLILHGAQDDLNSTQELQELADEIGPHAELRVWNDGNHGVTNRNLEVAPMMADWVAEKLR